MAYTAPNVTQSGLTFAQFQSSGVTGLLEKLIAVNSAVTAAPTAAPSGVAGSGGTLPNATYYITATETNGFGETTNGGQVSAGVAANAQKITVTFQALKSGNTARNVYIGTSASGPFTLVARGITASTYDITALPTTSFSAVNPPAVNTAGLVNVGAPRKLSFARAAEKGNLQDVYGFLRDLMAQYNSGQPIASDEAFRKLNDVAATVAILNQLCKEVGTLMDANPGTFTLANTGIGGSKTIKTFS